MCCCPLCCSAAPSDDERGSSQEEGIFALICSSLVHVPTHPPNPTTITTTTLYTASRRRLGIGWGGLAPSLPQTPPARASPPRSPRDHHRPLPNKHTQRPLMRSPPPLHNTGKAGSAVQCRQATMANASMRAAAAQYINPAVKLSHKTTVIRLYRKSLKTLNAWYVYTTCDRGLSLPPFLPTLLCLIADVASAVCCV